jgi:acyl-CoA synthetase (AMP-forming)/AMP-acid ligase II
MTTSPTNGSPSESASGWDFASVFEQIALAIPDAPAQSQGDRWFTWREFDERANGVARLLLDRGVTQQDKVAQYLYSAPEYLESVYACCKAGLAPVNTNYRYGADELVYLWDNADAVAVVFHGTFAPTIDTIKSRVPRVRTYLWVDDGSGPCPDWATPYESAAATKTDAAVQGPWGRSGDHLILLYTGGTTGMPKGVMWRQDDLIGALDSANRNRLPPGVDLAAAGRRVSGPGPRNLPAAPLMHGTGQFNAISNLIVGGSVHTMVGRSFDVVEMLDTIQNKRINSISIVGDAFGKPLLRALDAEPDRWDISSLRVIVSSGVMWSAETKAGLLRHNERLIMVDALGSSEAVGMASNVTTAGSVGKTATFKLGENTRVITEDGRDVVPGSGERGLVASRGRTPVGYYKDEAKSAATFLVLDGVRYSIPGDWAEVDADGTVRLLGRGSQCINTGGEKVYPEEVEEVLKLHPAVHDVAVIGLPDERFGEAVTAVVEPQAGMSIDERDVIAHVRARLAAYKSPKRVIVVDSVNRAANGKLDYRALTARAAEIAASEGP